MNGRLQSLIDRGYDKDLVLELASYSPEELDYFSDCALESSAKGCNPSLEEPVAIYIGGQPGCGKTTVSMNLKKIYSDIVEIGIDNYRTYHPNYLRMEEAIRKHWEGRVVTENDTPGNDIADFTHMFSGEMTDEVIRKATDAGYNVAIEWGMREPTEPLKNMFELKNKGYKINVMFVAVDQYTSMEACNIRSEVMNGHERIIRRIPPSFHELCVRTLPAAVDYLNENGYKKNVIDDLSLVSRNGKRLWDGSNVLAPSKIYNECLQRSEYKEFNNKEYAELAYQKEGEGIAYIDTFNNYKKAV